MCVYIKKVLSISYLPIVLLVSILMFCKVSPASALEDVTLQLKWMHQFQFAGYYAAVQQGYYRDAGLNVTIVPATPGKDPVKEVLNGKADYGVGTSSLLLERNAGKPVVSLAVIFQHSPYILLTKDSNASQTIHSLAGKRLMLEPQADELVAYLKAEGIPLEKIQMVAHSFSIKDLIDGKVDVISGYVTDDPHELERAGFPYHAYTPRSAGIDFYGDNIFTSEDELTKHPARAKAFREASLKGWQYAMQHPDEIINLIINVYSPQSDRSHLKYEAEQIRQLIQPNLVEIGYMHSGRWQHIADTYKDLGLMPKKVDLRKFMYDPHPQKNLTIFYWIASSFMGFALLIIAVRLIITSRNLKVSERQIREQYEEIEQINESLEEQVAERTADLHEAKLFSEQIISSAQEGVVVYDRNLRYRVWNPYMERLTNLPATEVLGSHPLKFFPFLQKSGIIERLEQILIDGIPFACDFPFSLPNAGVSGWTSDISAPLRNAQGDIVGIIATVRDVTEKRLNQQQLEDNSKRLEEINAELAAQFEESKALQEELADTLNKLQTNERNHTTIIQMAMDGYWVTDMQGHLLEVNDAYCRMSGYSEQELLSMTIADLEIIESAADVAAHIEKIMTKGEDFFTSQHRRKDGSIFAVEANVQYRPTEGGRTVVFMRDVTERKQMEKTMQQNLSYNRGLFEANLDALVTIDLEGKISDVNSACEIVTGYQRQELIGSKFFDYLTEPEKAQQGLQRVLLEGVARDFPLGVRHRNGHVTPVLASASLQYGECGNTIGFFASARDITEREQMMETLRKSEELYHSMVETSQDLIWQCDAEGRYTYLNPAWEYVLGYELQDILGKEFSDFQTPASAARSRLAFAGVMRGEQIKNHETTFIGKSGNKIHLVFNALYLFDEKEKIAGASGTAHDITELKNSEKRLSEITDRVMEQSLELKRFNELLEQRIYERTKELQASQSRINELSEKSHTVFWEVDAQGLYTYINHVSDLLFGYRPEEMIGRMHFYDLFPENDREAFKQSAFAAFGRMEQLNNIETRIQNKENRTIWISTNAIPMLGDDGSLLGYRGSDTDVTENKKLKEQLLQSQKMEAVGQLAGGLAHDFNNILSIINGYCCLLQMDIEDDERVKGAMDKILAASARAGELTHSMLAFSRTQVMKPEHQNLNGIVLKTAAFVEKIIGDNIQFKTVTNEATLPVFVDGGQIEQVLINLSNNARDAMPDGGELTITSDSMNIDGSFVSVHGFGKPGSYAVITVSDSGTGMDEATRKKIFEPFFTTKAVDKGTGLGLAMVYGIVKQHNGYIDVASEPCHGASFMIYLPIVESKTAASKVTITGSLTTSAGTETILIAEDNADLLEFMRKILVKLGYQVICAVNGQEAVDKFRENADCIHLIIMDMIMPKKSGKAAYDEIKQIKPGVMALFSSGYSAKIVQQQGELGENAEFISKPVQPAELMKKVREMLDRL